MVEKLTPQELDKSLDNWCAIANKYHIDILPIRQEQIDGLQIVGWHYQGNDLLVSGTRPPLYQFFSNDGTVTNGTLHYRADFLSLYRRLFENE